MSADAKKSKPQGTSKRTQHALSTSKDVTSTAQFPSLPPFLPAPLPLSPADDMYMAAFERELGGLWCADGLLAPTSSPAPPRARASGGGTAHTARTSSLSPEEYSSPKWMAHASACAPSVSPQDNGSLPADLADPMHVCGETTQDGNVRAEEAASPADPDDGGLALSNLGHALQRDEFVSCLHARAVGELLCESLAREIVETSAELYASRCLDRLAHSYTAHAVWDHVRASVANAFLPRDYLCSPCGHETCGESEAPRSCASAPLSLSQYLTELGTNARGWRAGMPSGSECDFIQRDQLLAANTPASQPLGSTIAPFRVMSVAFRHGGGMDSAGAACRLRDEGALAAGDVPNPVPIDEYCRYVVEVSPCAQAPPDREDGGDDLRLRPTATLSLAKSTASARAAPIPRNHRSSARAPAEASSATAAHADTAGLRPSTSPAMPRESRPAVTRARHAAPRADASRLSPSRTVPIAATSGTSVPTGAGQGKKQPTDNNAPAASGVETHPTRRQDALATALLSLGSGSATDRDAHQQRADTVISKGEASSPRKVVRAPGPMVAIEGNSTVPLGNVARESQHNLARIRRRREGAAAVPATTGGNHPGSGFSGAIEAAELSRTAKDTERKGSPRVRFGDSAAPQKQTATASEEKTGGGGGGGGRSRAGVAARKRGPRSGPTSEELAFVTLAVSQGQPAAADGARVATPSSADGACPVEVEPEAGVTVLEAGSGSAGPARAQGVSRKGQVSGAVRRRGEAAVLADGGTFPIPPGKEAWDTAGRNNNTSAAMGATQRARVLQRRAENHGNPFRTDRDSGVATGKDGRGDGSLPSLTPLPTQ